MNGAFKFLKKQWQPMLIIALIFGFFKMVEIWVSAQVPEEAAPEEQTAVQEVAAPEQPAVQELKKAELVGAETCLSCHGDRADFKKNIHAKAFPKAKGIEFAESCETCHGPGSLHAGAGGDKSLSDFWTVKNPKSMSSKAIAKSCLECHKGGERFHWDGSLHDSRDVSCLSCHSVHKSKSKREKSLLSKATELETCFQCHNMKKAQLQRSSHMPLREGKMSCTDCHNPHGGKGPSMIKQAGVNENCLSCHSEKKGPFLWEHPPVRENCLNCHLPHGSQHDRLLKAKRPRLCQECHIETRHPTDASTPSSLRLSARSCTECHSTIHGSNHPSGVRFLR